MTPRFSNVPDGDRSSSHHSVPEVATRQLRCDPPVQALPAPWLQASEAIPSPLAHNSIEHSGVEEFLRTGEVIETYVPESYEPKYSYPLLVWLHGGELPAKSFSDLMDGISDRNYLGLQLPLSQKLGQFSNQEEFLDRLHSEAFSLDRWIREEVLRFRRKHHVHSERIYLAGHGWGGMAALKMGLSRPEWYGGMIACDVGQPTLPGLLQHYRSLQGKRVLFSNTCVESSTNQRAFQRLLHAAGLKLCVRKHRLRADGMLPSTLLREIDRWVMMDIAQPQCV